MAGDRRPVSGAAEERGRGGRRRLLASGLSALLGAVAAAATWAQQAVNERLLKTQGEVLRTDVWQGVPPEQPLDTMIRLRRSDDNNGRAMTHEILSLIHEEKGRNSYPWTVYSSLETHHEVGDACVVCSRLHKYGPGWSAGLHSEVFSHHRAVALGVNVEMGNDYEGKEETRVIGVNVLAKGPRDADYGLHIHEDQGGFRTGIGLEGKGEVGIDVQGGYKVGINLHGHELRLGQGGSIALDDAGEVRLRYRNGALEFLKGDRRVAFLRLEGEDREL